MRIAQEHPEAKERILDAAHKLVLSQGFEGTTVDDICQAVKLTKGSFFHYFDSKEDLGQTLLQRYVDRAKESFLAAYPTAESDPAKRIFGFLDTVIERFNSSNVCGCLMGSMAQELGMTHPAVRTITQGAFSELGQFLTKDLAEAKMRKAPHASWDPKSVAAYFVVVVQGGQLLSKVQQDCSVMENALRHYKHYLEQLIG